jgi:hypothetical protein
VPGFIGATEVIDHAELYKRLQAGDGDVIDAPALLKARLVDALMGDWDRHRKQWRWARVPGNPGWVPIPEDRDQAFSRYEGLALAMGRGTDPRKGGHDDIEPTEGETRGWTRWSLWPAFWTRREFLQGVKRWSAPVATLALVGSFVALSASPAAA